MWWLTPSSRRCSFLLICARISSELSVGLTCTESSLVKGKSAVTMTSDAATFISRRGSIEKFFRSQEGFCISVSFSSSAQVSRSSRYLSATFDTSLFFLLGILSFLPTTRTLECRILALSSFWTSPAEFASSRP